MSVQIHPTAIVAKEAKLGENVKIGPKVEIGDGSELRAFSRVCDYTRMGAGCVIHEHAVIGGLPQDLSYRGEETWAILGDRVVCREFVTVNRAAGEGNVTQVGDGCFIMENVHLAHNVRIGHDCTIANKSGISGHVVVGDYVVIGGMTGFHQFTHIGSYCMIGGLSRITQDVPPYCLAAGIPLHQQGRPAPPRLRVVHAPQDSRHVQAHIQFGASDERGAEAARGEVPRRRGGEDDTGLRRGEHEGLHAARDARLGAQGGGIA